MTKSPLKWSRRWFFIFQRCFTTILLLSRVFFSANRFLNDARSILNKNGYKKILLLLEVDHEKEVAIFRFGEYTLHSRMSHFFKRFSAYSSEKIPSVDFEFVLFSPRDGQAWLNQKKVDLSSSVVVLPPGDLFNALEATSRKLLETYRYGEVSKQDRQNLLDYIEKIKAIPSEEARSVRVYLDLDEVIINWVMSSASNKTILVCHFVDWLVDTLDKKLQGAFDSVEYMALTARSERGDDINPSFLKANTLLRMLIKRGINATGKFYVGGTGVAKGEVIEQHQANFPTTEAIFFDDTTLNLEDVVPPTIAVKVQSVFEPPQEQVKVLKQIIEEINREKAKKAAIRRAMLTPLMELSVFSARVNSPVPSPSPDPKSAASEEYVVLDVEEDPGLLQASSSG